MNDFQGFNLDQQFKLLSRMGYQGPKDGTKMDEFMSASPQVAARMGKLATAAKTYQKSPVKAFAEGGASTPGDTRFYEANSPYVTANSPTATATSTSTEETTPPETLTSRQFSDQFKAWYKQYLGRDASNEDTQNGWEAYQAGTPLVDIQKQIAWSSEAGDTLKGEAGGTQTLESATAHRDNIQSEIASVTSQINLLTKKLNLSPNDEGLKAQLASAQDRLQGLEGDLTVAQNNVKNLTPSGQDLINQGLNDPASLLTKTEVATVGTDPNQFIEEGTGAITPTAEITAETVGETSTAEAPSKVDPAQYEGTKVYEDAKTLLDAFDPVTGEVTKQVDPATLDPKLLAALGIPAAQINKAVQIKDIGELKLTPEMLATAATLANYPTAKAEETSGTYDATAATFGTPTPEGTAATDTTLDPTKSATLTPTGVNPAATLDPNLAPEATAGSISTNAAVDAAIGTVDTRSVVDASKITANPAVIAQAVEATAATMSELNSQAVMVAAQGTFSQAMLAKAAQGSVPPQHTVQGQLETLMNQFNDGTPAWAAGAIRAANAAMAARGLGGSSMAGAAILQAAMESAVPIAVADAQIFENMRMANLSNRQQVALANAAAQQGLELANLNNRQQAALQNSTNAFALQTQSLSNTQEVILANQTIKAALVEKSLDINTAIALSNAGIYADINGINLSNQQQANIASASNKLQIDMANLSAYQNTALANLQVKAAIVGQNLTNEQQMAVLESAQTFEAAKFDATAKQEAFMQDAIAAAALKGQVLSNEQQMAMFNIANIMEERGLSFNAEQQTRLFNMGNKLQVDLANTSNRQQTALANAQIEATLKGQELSNKQQVNILNAERVAEIAQINFSTEERMALAQAEIINSVDLANLSAANAKVLSDAAALTQVDLTNLNNRQQAQVENARNFLQMDLTNTNNLVQQEIFKNQNMFNAMLSDQAADNAAKQFNAASENQVNMFFEELSSNISKFNAEQANLIKTFNTGETNGMKKFYAQLASVEAQFNANQAMVIAQANTKWRQTVALTDTANQHEANMQDAKFMNGMTMAAYDAFMQKERDTMSYIWQSYENQTQRAFDIFMADKQLDAAEDAADKEAKGYLFGKLLFGSGGTGGLLDTFTKGFTI